MQFLLIVSIQEKGNILVIAIPIDERSSKKFMFGITQSLSSLFPVCGHSRPFGTFSEAGWRL